MAAMVAKKALEEHKEANYDSDGDEVNPVTTIHKQKTGVGIDDDAQRFARSQTMAAFNYSADVKKSSTILSPHLEILASGSMVVCFDNMNTAHNLAEPLQGRLLIYLGEEFEAKNITINLIGYLRSHFSVQN